MATVRRIWATIDGAGRLVIPELLRDRLGLRPGEVELCVDGAVLRVEPITDGLEEAGPWLVIPSHGQGVSMDEVRELRGHMGLRPL